MANIAIMGFGTVGSGVFDIIRRIPEILKRNANGEEIVVKHILDIRDFSDHENAGLFTKKFEDILNDSSVSVVVEVMGGLHPAYEFTKELLMSGKSVVTSNKELVATYGTELLQLALEKNENYLFEASVGGGIPVIRPIHQCLTANRVLRIAGILNGTTNYILNEMINKGKTFDDALKDAQAKGYAEKNPAADIEGHDACRKIAILASLASRRFVDYNNIVTEGIVDISLSDVKYAEAAGCVIKLIGYAEFAEDDRLYSIVCPMVISKTSPLACVDDVYNAVMVTGDSVGDVMFYGKGAGKLPTASAVVADVIDAVKHSERSKKIAWTDVGYNFMISPDEKKFSYFIRTSATREKIKEVFDIKQIYDIGIDGEIGFITEPVAESEIQKKTEALGSVLSSIRVME
ncbi:MAG: homoserine dehydrogenase [Clostridia bacterium]|nr:homoserine dehydrogenase [Clostridia bacterium]